MKSVSSPPQLAAGIHAKVDRNTESNQSDRHRDLPEVRTHEDVNAHIAFTALISGITWQRPVCPGRRRLSQRHAGFGAMKQTTEQVPTFLEHR